MEALDIKTVFTLTLFGRAVPITETVVISWLVMAILIVLSLAVTRRLREVPRGGQIFAEAAVEFLNSFCKGQFGSLAKYFASYVGTLFLFLLVANTIGVLSPVEINCFGLHFEPPFVIKPPTRDINVTAPLALITMSMVLLCGLLRRGPLGWIKQLFHPVPLMLPFNLMDYATRLISLSLRLFGNMLGGFVLMRMIEGILPLALPMIFSLYFDFFDGIVQAAIFVFLSCMYLSEAVTVEEHIE
ncbi:MAG: F0F1 ATP synthase subunit A [Treponema sp.]|nr:F0F1 ATP synthase subunit A [Treponema sp.]